MEQEVSDLVSVKLLLATVRHGKNHESPFSDRKSGNGEKIAYFPSCAQPDFPYSTLTNKKKGIQNLGDNLPVTLVDKGKHTNKCERAYLFVRENMGSVKITCNGFPYLRSRSC